MQILIVILLLCVIALVCLCFFLAKENKKLRATLSYENPQTPVENNLNNEKQQEELKVGSREKMIFLNDIIKLINKNLPKKNEYVDLLNRIDRPYFKRLESLYNGNLSVHYLKYCVCFAIGMKIDEVSECFSIEQSSVHMIRYRLKKKFGLSINDDLDLFLQKGII